MKFQWSCQNTEVSNGSAKNWAGGTHLRDGGREDFWEEDFCDRRCALSSGGRSTGTRLTPLQ